MKLTVSGKIDVPDKNAFLNELRKEARRVFMLAGRKFLIAAVARVPVYTGMARGAFRNAEDLFGKVTSDVSSPTGFRIRTTQGRGGAGRGGGSRNTVSVKAYYYPPGGARIQRTPEAGRQFSTPTDQIIDVTGGSLASGRTAFYFKYSIDITYFELLDPIRWGAMKAATDDLVAYVKANFNVPDPFKNVQRRVIK